VTCPSQFVRGRDVIFPKNSARLNNCGRLVLRDVSGRLASDDAYIVYLIGHRDSDEPDFALAMNRAYNIAAA
jgi:outer membrane protein OmpA-like peptidoglycan-associated protein